VAKKWPKSGHFLAIFRQKVANFVPNGRIIKRQEFWRFLAFFCPSGTPPGPPLGGGTPPGGGYPAQGGSPGPISYPSNGGLRGL
jgi:hypothetical protein